MFAFFMIFLGALWHIIDGVETDGGLLAALWTEGLDANGGGLIGGIIGHFVKSFASDGSIVIIGAIVLILFICVFNIFLCCFNGSFMVWYRQEKNST
jgi:hypothetical protein